MSKTHSEDQKLNRLTSGSLFAKVKSSTEAENYPEAMEAIQSFLKHFPERQIGGKYLLAVSKHLDTKGFINWLTELIEIAPNSALLLHLRASYFFRIDDAAGAFNDIAKSCELDPFRRFRFGSETYLGKLVAANPDYYSKLETLYNQYPRNASLLWTWARMLMDSGQVDAYRAAVETNWSWAKNENPPGFIQYYMSCVDNSRINPDSLRGKHLYNFHLMANDIEAAHACAQNPQDKAITKQILETIPSEYPVMDVLDYRKDSLIIGRDRPNGVVLTFGGLFDKAAMPAHILDYFFAELGLTVIHLQDFKRHIYLNGIQPYGATLSETITILKQEIKVLGRNKPLYTFGNSAGGLAAMIYGAKLGAKRTVVFSPPASVNPDFLNKISEGRAGIVRRRLIKNINHEETNLARILSEAGGDYKAYVYVGGECENDVAHAKLIEDMPKTKVHYFPNSDVHTAFPTAVERIGLLNLMKNDFEL